MVDVRRISVIVPMRNEAAHIEEFVADLARQDFDGEVELFVADGGSTDESVALLERAAAAHGLPVEVIPNPRKWVAPGLNACLRRVSGDLIVRLDCHSRYPEDYLRRCAIASQETGAENVGGVFDAEGRTTMERAIACAMDNPFGGVGWRLDIPRTGRVEADTVPYGAFRPRAFELAGPFDETLCRNQDDEFNLRLRMRGGRVVLDPAIRVIYTPRASLRKLFRQYYQYGLWKVPVMLKHRKVVSLRSLAPAAFLASTAVLALFAPLFDLALFLLVVELGAYGASALVFGASAVIRRGEPWRLLPRVLAAFGTFHLAYGLGMVQGWASAAARRLRRRPAPPPAPAVYGWQAAGPTHTPATATPPNYRSA